jgi:hypothetical protein
VASKTRGKKQNKSAKKSPGRGLQIHVYRAFIETGFIIFLFYSNLLMGEFTRSNSTPEKSLMFAITDIFTSANFAVALITSLIGYLVFEYFRKVL